MLRQVTQSLIIFALASAAGGSAAPAETYGPQSSAYYERQARLADARISNGEAAERTGREEEMEYRALVEPEQEVDPSLQPGDVAVKLNGAKVKIKLGL